MTQSVIAFGANLGDAQASLEEATQRLADHERIQVVAVAKPVVTAAVTGEDGHSSPPRGQATAADPPPDYLNSAILIETSLTARELFHVTCGLENDMGRQRKQRWGPRTIDLDIILFGRQVIVDPQLQVPHRRMSFRKFVIGPASEIAGGMIDPISGVSLKGLADRLWQSPRAILWITEDEVAAQATVDSWRGRDWDFKIAQTINAVQAPQKDFRLMLFSHPKEKFEQTAIQFAGPWLNLTGLRQAQCQTEIRAAIQAMA